MADRCKYEKYQYQVSYNSGATWENVTPIQVRKGDITEYMSLDCSEIETLYRWVDLQGTYICEDKNKYTREIQEESYDDGVTWYTSYPTVYRQGTFVGIDEEFCNDKFEGHYIFDEDVAHNCPKYYSWNGVKCVYIDPLKVVRCNDNTTLTSSDTKYYTKTYTLSHGEIGDCVTAIDNEAFSVLFGLTGMTIPDNVESIGTNAFYDNANMTYIKFGNGLKTIGQYAFGVCVGLTELEIPSGVTSIGYQAFYRCTNLEKITVYAETPPTLGSQAFDNTNDCPIYVPYNSVDAYKSAWSSYRDRIFSYPIKIKATYIGGDEYRIDCDSSTELTSGDTRPNGYEISAMTSIYIGDCVTSIGSNAFNGFYNLSAVTIPNTIETIGNYVFYGCSSLNNVRIPRKTTSIGTNAFNGCSGLTSITILAATPPTLGSNAFDNTNDSPIYVPFKTVDVYKAAWPRYEDRIFVMPCKLYAEYPFDVVYDLECDSSTELTSGDTKPTGYTYSDMIYAYIGDCVTSIGASAFTNCTSLNNVTISSGVTSINGYAFGKCSSLTSVTISNGVTNIGGMAFQSCSSLTSIAIPNSVTNIGVQAFRYCSSLSSVTIGSGVTSIGNAAFRDCSSHLRVTVNATTPPTLVSSTSFGTNIKQIYVPCNSVSAYKTATNWSNYALIIQPIPPCEAQNKFVGIYNNGETTHSVQCNSDSNLTNSETRPNTDFFAYTSMTSAYVGDCVTSIGAYAFNYCISLKRLNSNTDGVFIIPSGITSIGASSFSSCSGMTRVTIPDSVTNVGHGAFNYCGNLPIENNIRYADTVVVEATDKTLTTYTLKNGTRFIGSNAFDGCSSLTSIVIPDSVTSIGVQAFYNCSGLTSIDIPSGVTTINYLAFENCVSLTSVTVNSITPPLLEYGDVFENTNNCPIYVPCESLYSYRAYDGWKNYSERIVGIPPCDPPITYKLITKYNDSDDYELMCDESGSLSSGDTHPTGYTYSAMTSAEIGNCVAIISSSAFDGCNSLTSVTIPNSVTIFEYHAFNNCISLTSLDLPNSVTNINFGAFFGCSGLTTCTIGSGVTSIGERAFAFCSSLTSLDIPDSVTSIGMSAFTNCTSLTSITIGSGVTTINDGTFNTCTSLTSIGPVGSGASFEIPSGITSIGTSAFRDCSGLTNLVIPDSVTFISSYVFAYCSGLTSVIIGNGITSISEHAFAYCRGPMTCVIGSSVTTIGSNAFYQCSGLTSIDIPNNVISISGGAFKYCSSLTSVTIGSGVTSISQHAFGGCSSLTSIDIPNSVTSIGVYAFSACTNLTSVTIGDGVTSIASNTFLGCYNLTSCTIGSGVTSIKNYAFWDCTSLVNLTIKAITPPSMERYVFSTNVNLSVIYVPSESVSVYQSAWSRYASIIQAIPT